MAEPVGQYAASPKEPADLDRYIAGVAKHYATDPNYRTSITAEAHSSTVQNAIARAIISPPQGTL